MKHALFADARIKALHIRSIIALSAQSDVLTILATRNSSSARPLFTFVFAALC
jgi:hypothetical protein